MRLIFLDNNRFKLAMTITRNVNLDFTVYRGYCFLGVTIPVIRSFYSSHHAWCSPERPPLPLTTCFEFFRKQFFQSRLDIFRCLQTIQFYKLLHLILTKPCQFILSTNLSFILIVWLRVCGNILQTPVRN